MEDFGKNAKLITKNPLGILALFITVIYGIACQVFSNAFENL